IYKQKDDCNPLFVGMPDAMPRLSCLYGVDFQRHDYAHSKEKEQSEGYLCGFFFAFLCNYPPSNLQVASVQQDQLPVTRRMQQGHHSLEQNSRVTSAVSSLLTVRRPCSGMAVLRRQL